MFLPLQFSTPNASLHTPFVYVSIPPTPCCRPMLFFAIKQKYFLYPVLYTIPLCCWKTVALHSADSVEVPHTQNAVDSCITPVTKTQHLQSPHFQPAVPEPIQWHSHSKTKHNTDSWTITFPSPCTSNTHHCIQYMLFLGTYTEFYVPKFLNVELHNFLHLWNNYLITCLCIIIKFT